MYVWFLVAAIASAIPIPLIKYYIIHKKILCLWLAITCYYVLVYAYIQILRTKDITVVYPFLKVLSILFVVGAGGIFFKNKMNGEVILGLTLAIMSLYLLGKNI